MTTLVLSRSLRESIVIGDDISVTVVGITGGQVRLAVAAPASVQVHRSEVARRIARDGRKKEASHAAENS